MLIKEKIDSGKRFCVRIDKMQKYFILGGDKVMLEYCAYIPTLQAQYIYFNDLCNDSEIREFNLATIKTFSLYALKFRNSINALIAIKCNKQE